MPEPFDPDIAVVQAELLAREPIFHRPAFGTARADLLAQTAEDFWEVGASGQAYDRDHVIETVLERGPVPGDQDWTVSEAACRRLGPATFLLTYLLDQPGRRTRRATVWERHEHGWRIVYHQGTVLAAGAD
jgi:hypothetical protein